MWVVVKALLLLALCLFCPEVYEQENEMWFRSCCVEAVSVVGGQPLLQDGTCEGQDSCSSPPVDVRIVLTWSTRESKRRKCLFASQ